MHNMLEEIMNEFVSYEYSNMFYGHDFHFGNNKRAVINLEYLEFNEKIKINERDGVYQIQVPKGQEIEFRQWVKLLNV